MLLHTQLSVVILFFCLSVACMASSVVACIHAMPQAVADHILGFASNELARAFMMVQELQTFVIMDPAGTPDDEGAAATFEWLRSTAQGHRFLYSM